MPDYSKGVIYKLETGGQLYVGSTCNFTKRKYEHKQKVNLKGRGCNAKVYNTIRENGEWKMTPIKEFPCENKTQLVIEEEKCRKELGATLNSQQCYCTDDEIREKKLETDKQYYQVNKEKLIEQAKQYREQNKEKIREKNKENYQKNKEQICEQKKHYHQNNREKILEQNKQKSECPICGSVVTRKCMVRHQRSKKCKAIALQLEQN